MRKNGWFRNCPICGTTFYTTPSVEQKTCSPSCGMILVWKGKEYREALFNTLSNKVKQQGKEVSLYGNGYKYVFCPDHPLASRGRVTEQLLIAEKVLGRHLKRGEIVHHVNGIKTDNRNCNLVLCESQAYHLLLHARERALSATGNPNHRRCKYCHTWDDTLNLIHDVSCSSYYHRHCRRSRMIIYRNNHKNKIKESNRTYYLKRKAANLNQQGGMK